MTISVNRHVTQLMSSCINYYIYICLIMVCSCSSTETEDEWTESQEIFFSKVFGEYDAEMGYSIRSTDDGGYIIAGATSSYWATDSLPKVLLSFHGVTDAIIAKIDRYGNQEWIKTYGGDRYESAFNAKQTSDGGYFFMGYTNSMGEGLYDFWLVKLDASGSVLWQKTYGTYQSDIGFYGDITSDGGFILTGHTYLEERTDKDIWLIKTDEEGSVLWSKTYGDSMSQSAIFLQETGDGGFILLGKTTGGSSQSDILLIKTDMLGAQDWQKQIAYSGNDVPYAVKETIDGYIVISTTTSMGQGEKDILLSKFDYSGNLVWEKTYGGGALEYGFDVKVDSDGYVLVGSTSSYGTMFYDMWILKVDQSGEIIWEQIYSGTNIDIGRSIIANGSGGYVVLAQTSSYGAGEYDFWVLKIDENGVIPVQ